MISRFLTPYTGICVKIFMNYFRPLLIKKIFIVLFSSFLQSTQVAATPLPVETDGTPKMCAAIRGNGAKIYVHFGSLAKFHETYGMFWAVSGGSSGSVVSFLLESMYANPLLTDCGDHQCHADETAARAALLMKTFAAEPEALKSFPESTAFFMPMTMAREITQRKVDQLLLTDPDKGISEFKNIINQPSISRYVNPELIQAIDQAPDAAKMANDLVGGILGARDFKLDSHFALIRPGATSFPALTEFFGRVASFYAGRADGTNRAAMQSFFNSCATPGRGKEWAEVSHLPVGKSTCGQVFSQQLQDFYRSATTTQPQTPSRADDKIGTLGALRVLASVTQMSGESAKMWKTARAAYLKQKPIVWQSDFKDWSIAYAGRNEDLNNLLANRKQYSDFKTGRANVITDMSWRDMIERSPAEPSTSRGLELSGGSVTTGGWADGQPVLALKNIGCDEVVLFDTVPNKGFQSRVAEILGATAQDLDALVGFNNPKSSLVLSVREADAVWCVDWVNTKASTPQALASEGWNGVFEVRSARLEKMMQGRTPMVAPPNQSVCTAPFN